MSARPKTAQKAADAAQAYRVAVEDAAKAADAAANAAADAARAAYRATAAKAEHRAACAFHVAFLAANTPQAQTYSAEAAATAAAIQELKQ